LGGDGTLAVLKQIARHRPEHLEWSEEWDNWWDMQLGAVKALGRYGDEEAVAMLVELLEEGDAEDIEDEIFRALAGLGEKGREALVERLQSGLARGRRRAARALGGSGSPEAARALGRALQDGQSEVRAAVVEALVRLKAQRYLSAILLLLRDENAEVRGAAAAGAVELAKAGDGSRELAEQLAPLLLDPSPRVRAVTMDTLSHSIDPAAVTPEMLEAVRQSLNHEDVPVAEAAVTLIGRVGEAEEVQPLLTRILGDRERDPIVRRQAALALGGLKQLSPTAIPALRDAVVDPSQTVRLAALTALMDAADGVQPQADGEEPALTPLSVVIAAARGEIEIPQDEPREQSPAVEGAEPQATAAEAAVAAVEEKPIGFDRNAMPRFNEDADAAEEVAVAGPEPAAEGTEELPLPDAPPPQLENAELKPAQSTLDAIAMDNAEVTLMFQEETDAEEAPLSAPADPELAPFFELIDETGQRAERMFPNRKIDVAEDVRHLGVRILSRSGDEEVLQALVQILSDENPRIRGEAAQSIAEIAARDPETTALMNAFGTLVTLLGVEQPEQKIACVRALANLRNRAAVPPLLDALGDGSVDVRIHAVRALAALAVEGRDPAESDHMVTRAIPPRTLARKIADCLNDPANGVRTEAAKALAGVVRLDEAADFAGEAQGRIIEAAFEDAGQQARSMGRALRSIDAQTAEEELLRRLDEASDSAHRRFVIEMLEELFKPVADA
jgi:HEAT repeat protein